MPYIPKEHERYNLLPYCREHGGEVFEYPSELIYEAEKLLGSADGITPYNYDSYEQYYEYIDALIAQHEANPEIKQKLLQVRDKMLQMNRKEDWSVLKYVGPTDDSCFGLTHGKNYYWPTRREKPTYCGVVDDEEFTAYLYPTEAGLWEILVDPTGMAHRTIYGGGKDYLSQEEYDSFMAQIGRQFSEMD